MANLVSPSDIERIVGVPRHPYMHCGRVNFNDAMVYVMHSQKCRDAFRDLRDCPYSHAIDKDIDPDRWIDHFDTPVELWISSETGQLIPRRKLTTTGEDR